ncbi:putative asparagine synthase (glutamine-hydrolyzing) [Rosa chinensis]|uniref:Putative asparagine synthase (Glutamine-hydrolyzing) n=1 Tax=Rosa chinensis TaxID=74649 RepID=A0A2P6RT62_ROSCH|nr:putative asparagine synthase (glutamine-hydrolyzing) [Rosa chinensis]
MTIRCLLSGGLDLSLVAAAACRYLAKLEAALQWGSSSIPFASAGRSEGIDALEVIYHLETYDVNTVRARTPMFLKSNRTRLRMNFLISYYTHSVVYINRLQSYYNVLQLLCTTVLHNIYKVSSYNNIFPC